MLTLPDAIVVVLVPFATLFSSPTWRKAQLLLVGAILTPGQRTVAAALRVMGLSDDRNYARYHEVVNRAAWSSREAVAPAPAPGSRRRPVDLRRAIIDQSRNPGTASGSQDQGAGNLSRPGAFQPPPIGQGQRVVLDLSDVAGPRPLGGMPLGLAGAHGAGALVSLPPAPGDAGAASDAAP